MVNEAGDMFQVSIGLVILFAIGTVIFSIFKQYELAGICFAATLVLTVIASIIGFIIPEEDGWYGN